MLLCTQTRPAQLPSGRSGTPLTPDPDVPPTAPSNSPAPAAVQPEHPGSVGVAIMCDVALEEGWSFGGIRLVRGVLRDRSVPPIMGAGTVLHSALAKHVSLELHGKNEPLFSFQGINAFE